MRVFVGVLNHSSNIALGVWLGKGGRERGSIICTKPEQETVVGAWFINSSLIEST